MTFSKECQECDPAACPICHGFPQGCKSANGFVVINFMSMSSCKINVYFSINCVFFVM